MTTDQIAAIALALSLFALIAVWLLERALNRLAKVIEERLRRLE